MIDVRPCRSATSKKVVATVASNFRCFAELVCLPEGTVPNAIHAHLKAWAVLSPIRQVPRESCHFAMLTNI